MVDIGLVEDTEPPADGSGERRRYYRITELGRRVVSADAERMRSLARAFNQMSERLEDSDARRRAFLADVSHESDRMERFAMLTNQVPKVGGVPGDPALACAAVGGREPASDDADRQDPLVRHHDPRGYHDPGLLVRGPGQLRRL